MGADRDWLVTGQGSDAATPWVECHGVVREAARGRVRCPLRGRTVEVRSCLACRHLVGHSGERDDLEDCRTPDPYG